MDPTRCLLLAASRGAPGARQTLVQALGGGGRVPVLLSEAGLDWAQDESLRAAHERGAVQIAVCTVSARDQGWHLEAAPGWIAWSGVAVWLLKHADAAEIWVVTP